ncbi:MAG TPA: helix-turn-helix transcriptional regulator [Thermoanaerobaculia bacterium]|nr:helix-turn-helix transcriptional regulator [Thermoanaerobaculia bacterium]
MHAKRKLTQQALAAAAGIPQTHVSAIELGQMSPTLITLVRLAVALDCKVAKLVSILDESDLASLLPK